LLVSSGKQQRTIPERLVLAADADRRAIERELHQGVQQHLVALSVALQLAEQAVDADPEAVKSMLEDMRGDVQQAVDEAARLAQRIYPATLELGGFAALLRSAAVSAGVPAVVEVDADPSCPPEVAMTVYLCWLDALGRAGGERRATIRVRESEDALDFDVLADGAHSGGSPDWLQDRVEALGGWVAITRRDGGGVSVSGSLPLGR
jgi:signal transduction histidine kinase